MIERFLEQVQAEHQSKVSDAVLQDALREMRAHLEESRDAFLTAGNSVEESEALSVKAFGNPSLAVPLADPLIEWRITRQSYGLVAFLAFVSSFLGVNALNQAIKQLPLGSEALQTFVVTLLFTGMLATPALVAYRQRKIHATAIVVTILFTLLLVDGPTKLGTQPWTSPLQPSPNRVAEYQRALAELFQARQVVDAVESYRQKLQTPGSEPNWEVVAGKRRYPTTLKVAGDGVETKIYLSDESLRSSFADASSAKAESLRRIARILPSLRANATDATALNQALDRAFGDWLGNAWENSQEYLTAAGFFLVWALFSQACGSLMRRVTDRWRPSSRKKA